VVGVGGYSVDVEDGCSLKKGNGVMVEGDDVEDEVYDDAMCYSGEQGAADNDAVVFYYGYWLMVT